MSCFAHGDGGSAGRIHFTTMMHFKDFRVIVFEQFGGEFEEFVGNVYTGAHVR